MNDMDRGRILLRAMTLALVNLPSLAIFRREQTLTEHSKLHVTRTPTSSTTHLAALWRVLTKEEWCTVCHAIWFSARIRPWRGVGLR